MVILNNYLLINLKGKGCKICGIEKTKVKLSKTSDVFIKELKEIYDDYFEKENINKILSLFNLKRIIFIFHTYIFYRIFYAIF